MSDAEEAPKANCSFTFKRRGDRRGGVCRQRRQAASGSSSSGSSGEDAAAVVRVEKRKKINPMIQKSGGLKKFKGRAGENSSSSSDEDEKARAKNMAVVFGSSGATVQKNDQNATATREVDTELEKDQRAINDRAEEIKKMTKGQEDDKVYRGLNYYNQYIDKKESLIGKRLTIKPIRAPTNVRSTVRWDYEPMLCKDYKETGYCGFGDTCKFMHDRSDYKHGWQMDKEFEAGHYDSSDEDKYVISEEDDLPHKCGLCHQKFVNPVSTRCKHYFCEKCALDHYRKSQRCATCGAQTSGTFNPAKDLIERMAKWAAEGREFKSDDESDGDPERLPDESKPQIPEDDPDYYSTVHAPHT